MSKHLLRQRKIMATLTLIHTLTPMVIVMHRLFLLHQSPPLTAIVMMLLITTSIQRTIAMITAMAIITLTLIPPPLPSIGRVMH